MIRWCSTCGDFVPLQHWNDACPRCSQAFAPNGAPRQHDLTAYPRPVSTPRPNPSADHPAAHST